MLLFFTAFMVVAYSIYALKLACKILIKNSGQSVRYVPAALVNATLLLGAYHMSIIWSVLFVLVFIVLFLEFWLYSKANILSVLFGASGFAIHIALTIMLFVVLFADYKGILPIEVWKNKDYFYICIGSTFLVAFMFLFLLRNKISSENMIALAFNKTYSTMVSIIALTILSYTFIDSIMLTDKQYFSNITVTIVSTVVLSIALFYTLLLYSMSSIKMAVFKTKSDSLTEQQIKSQEYQAQLKERIVKDVLTRCYNRTYVMNELRRKFTEGTSDFGVSFIDIDGLKKVNDTFGHDEGDTYIIGVSEVFLSAVEEGDIVSRVGGDEFILLLNCKNEREMRTVTERIESHIKQLDQNTSRYDVSVSIGSVFVDKNRIKLELEKILKLADDIMMKVKKEHHARGKNGC